MVDGKLTWRVCCDQDNIGDAWILRRCSSIDNSNTTEGGRGQCIPFDEWSRNAIVDSKNDAIYEGAEKLFTHYKYKLLSKHPSKQRSCNCVIVIYGSDTIQMRYVKNNAQDVKR